MKSALATLWTTLFASAALLGNAYNVTVEVFEEGTKHPLTASTVTKGGKFSGGASSSISELSVGSVADLPVGTQINGTITAQDNNEVHCTIHLHTRQIIASTASGDGSHFRSDDYLISVALPLNEPRWFEFGNKRARLTVTPFTFPASPSSPASGKAAGTP